MLRPYPALPMLFPYKYIVQSNSELFFLTIKLLSTFYRSLEKNIPFSERERTNSPIKQNMQTTENLRNVTVVWRGNKYVVEMKSDASLKELGDELQKLTDVKSDTMRFIVPQFANKNSKLLSPFSDEHSRLSLQEASITEGKSIRMMGVSEDEVDKVLQNAKVDQRIVGFDEEEKRMRQRMSDRSHALLKLPQGPYIFCDFRTLQLPGVELNPPASEALKRMHMLAADPGIIAIMNKHRWRVGIMTEMAPVGYVGVSPECILGFNKNHGEEISLRLRTDDLKGFRKYESIKKTLLHELAHMVFSEHDANFYALDSQLNKEAGSLDWTKSRGHSLGGISHSDHYEEDYVADSKTVPHKLGGDLSEHMASARAASVAAAYRRLSDASANGSRASDVHEEPDPDDALIHTNDESAAVDHIGKESMDIGDPLKYQPRCDHEPCPDKHSCDQRKSEIDSEVSCHSHNSEIHPRKIVHEPEPDDVQKRLGDGVPNDGSLHTDSNAYQGPDTDDYESNSVAQAEPDPDDSLVSSQKMSSMQIDEPDPDDQELQRIQDPVTVVCGRLQKAIETVRAEVSSTEATTTLQTLLKIIRNVIEHPDNTKFKRLRKANPLIQKTISSHQAAMEILHMVGFVEEATFDQNGRPETYLVLKRNDPGLLWLAKSSLETCVVL